MSRIAKLPVDRWDAELRTVTAADTGTPLERGLMRMMAHAPGVAKGVTALGASFRRHHTLPDRLMEMLRLRVAFHNQCRSCMAIRYQSALDDGLDEDLVCSLEKPADAPNLSPGEKAVLAYADLFATNHLAIGEVTFDELRLYFSETYARSPELRRATDCGAS